jgi:hypothetical protein
MDAIDQYIETLTRTNDEFAVSGAQTSENIAALERALSLALPPSYRSFVQRFGAVANGDDGISGIWNANPTLPNEGSAYGDTTRCRQQHGLPAHFIVIGPDDEAPYCLDTSKQCSDGECPVVCYELRRHHASPVAASFHDFIVEWLELRAAEDDD